MAILYNDVRAGVEGEIFSYPQDMVPRKRPIYGDVRGKKIINDEGSLDQYGRNRIVFKDDIKKRTTISGGDTLNNEGEMMPMPFEQANGRAVVRDWAPDVYEDGTWQTANYVEAQMHGGVRVEDIKKVILDRKDSTFQLQERLDMAGIDWEFAE